MTRSNRALNRIFLALVGLVALAVAVILAAPTIETAIPAMRIPHPQAPTLAGLWIVAGIALLVVVVSVSWIVTRGRGRISTILAMRSNDGTLTVDSRLVSDLVGDALGANPDVVSVGAGAFRVRGSSVLSIRVVARRGSDLAALVTSAERSIADLDEVLQQRIPVLLQVASGLRADLARDTRTR
jgi:hypothetical protein